MRDLECENSVWRVDRILFTRSLNTARLSLVNTSTTTLDNFGTVVSFTSFVTSNAVSKTDFHVAILWMGWVIEGTCKGSDSMYRIPDFKRVRYAQPSDTSQMNSTSSNAFRVSVMEMGA